MNDMQHRSLAGIEAGMFQFMLCALSHPVSFLATKWQQHMLILIFYCHCICLALLWWRGRSQTKASLTVLSTSCVMAEHISKIESSYRAITLSDLLIPKRINIFQNTDYRLTSRNVHCVTVNIYLRQWGMKMSQHPSKWLTLLQMPDML